MPYRDIAYLAGRFRGQGVSGGLPIFRAAFERKYPEVMAALAGLDLYERDFIKLLLTTLAEVKRPAELDRAGRGVVIIKTIKRRYARKNYDTGEVDFYWKEFRYVYIAHDRRGGGKSWHYADKGLGPGHAGGKVANALDTGLVTKDQILDRWAEGAEGYTQFIDSLPGYTDDDIRIPPSYRGAEAASAAAKGRAKGKGRSTRQGRPSEGETGGEGGQGPLPLWPSEGEAEGE